MLTTRSLIIVLVLTTFAGAANIWQQVPTPSGASQIRDFTINPSNNHWFIADRQSGFWKSTDQGKTWTQINNSGIPQCGWTIEYDSFHNQLLTGVFVGDSNQCGSVSWWRSSNEGTTWTQISSSVSLSLNPTFSGPLIDPNGLIDFGGRDGSIQNCGGWWSSDGGNSTNIFNASPGCQGPWGFLYNPITRDYWFGTEAGGIYRGTDGKNWNRVLTDPPGPGNAIGLSYDSNGNTLVSGRVSGSGGVQGIWRSSGSNGNYTWTQILSSTGTPRAIFRDPNGNLYYGQQDCGCSSSVAIYRSIDQGNSWNPWTSGIPGASNGNNLEAWHFVYNSTDGKLYTNVQDGATNNGYVYVTVQPITSVTAGLQPPTNLQLAIQ